MIKNSRAALALALALGAVSASCSRPRTTPEGFQGIVEYDERVIGFEVPGRVARVAVARGDAVKAGDTLAALDATLERLTRDASLRSVEAARADVALVRAGSKREDVASIAAEVHAAESVEELARKTRDRARALYATQTITQAEVERADGELEHATYERKAIAQRLGSLRRGARAEEIARSEARASEAASALAFQEERLARYVLRAEGAGTVVDVHVKVGELAATGTAAVTLADTQHPYVDVFVPQGELDGIHAGGHAMLRVDAATSPFSCVVEHVSPKTEFSPKFLFSERERPHLVVRVRLRVDDPEGRLHAGVPAFARVER